MPCPQNAASSHRGVSNPLPSPHTRCSEDDNAIKWCLPTRSPCKPEEHQADTHYRSSCLSSQSRQGAQARAACGAWLPDCSTEP